MEKPKLLIVTQELSPYVELSEIAGLARKIPLHMQDKGMEIRLLMPKFGTINERRHRLHEVVRLSGINIIIDQDDYPLLIKVASMPGARIQVYFLDNEDFFKRKAVFGDKKNSFFGDNSERMIFFCKGVLETVKKFGWAPDIIHCMGWMTSLIPFYIKTAYKNEPVFSNAKVVYTVYDKGFKQPLSGTFAKKALQISKKIDIKDFSHYKEGTSSGLEKGAIQYADAVVMGSPSVNGEVKKFLDKAKKPVLSTKPEPTSEVLTSYQEFYQSLLHSN